MPSEYKDLEAFLTKLGQIETKIESWIQTKYWTAFCTIAGVLAVVWSAIEVGVL